MRRIGLRSSGVLLIFITVVFVHFTTAEVYKWVDEEGNIHFGDKPRDSALAEQAESVDIVESYQPDTRTAQDQDAFDRDQQAIRRKTELYKREDATKRKAEQENRKEQKAERCAAMAEDIRKITAMHNVDGVRTYYYLTGDDGKSLSSAQQKELIEGLRKKYAAAGCN